MDKSKQTFESMLIDHYTDGSGRCTAHVERRTDKPGMILTLTFYGGCDPGDYIEIDISDPLDATADPNDLSEARLVEGVRVQGIDHILQLINIMVEHKRTEYSLSDEDE